MLRSGSKAAADADARCSTRLKGYLPVALAVRFGPAYGLGEGTVALVALAAFLGHLWPVFFRFRGGKGVATAAGALFGIDPLLGARDARDLADHRRVLPLLVARVDRRRRVRAVLARR